MFVSETKIRVRYSETDKMGYCYYGNYAQYFEVARVESLRTLGVTYKEMEDQGVLLPVASFEIKYKAPAYYDDEIIVKSFVHQLPDTRIHFEYECYVNEKLINTAKTTLVFVDAKTMKPMMAPSYIINCFKNYFS